jgi:hypothetical protein
MGLNNAFSDETLFGITALSANKFLICQTGGGYQGKTDSDGLVYYQWTYDQEAVNDELGGGDLTSAPAVAGSHVAARGLNGNIYYKASPSGEWSELPKGELTSAPAICKRGDYIHIFACGTDHQLWHTYKVSSPTSGKTPNGGWIAWQKEKENIPDLPGGIKSAPSVVAPSDSRIDIVVLGNDNHVYHLFYKSTSGWAKNWELLGGDVTAAPTCCWLNWSDTPTDIQPTFHVFARGTDNQIWHRYFDKSGGWHNPNNPADNLGWGNDVPAHPKGGIYSAPVAVVDSPGQLNIFAGSGGAEVWNVRWTKDEWQNWKPIRINNVFYPAG